MSRKSDAVDRWREMPAVAEAVSSIPDPRALIAKLLGEACRLAPADRAVVLIADGPRLRLVPAGWHGFPRDADSRKMEQAVSEGPAGESFRGRRVVQADSSAFIPMVSHDSVVGVFHVARTSGEQFTPEDLGFLGLFATFAASSIRGERFYQELLNIQEAWDTSFNAFPDPIFTVDAERRIRRANRGFLDRFKLQPNEISGALAWNVMGFASAGEAPWEEVFLKHKAINRDLAFSLAKEATFHLDAYPVTTKSGTIAEVVVFLRETTERKRLEQELMHAEKLSAVGGLVSGVAHEMNNPMSSVLGFAELAAAAEGVPEDVKGYLTIVSEEARRAVKIVRNLLTFARQHKPERSQAQINEIIERVTELLAYELRINKIKVTADLDKKLPTALIDPHQIQQVLFNLFTNAMYAMAEQKKPGVLTITTRSMGGGITLTVADSGPGIPPEVLPKIFDPFYTTKPPGKGTGLGLSVCTGIIKEHNGTIGVVSSPGKGARFEIFLPFVPVEAAEERALASTRRARIVKDRKILVVDDEPGIIALLSNLLREHNLVISANDGQGAIELLRKETVDLVITDMKMPIVGGRELYQFISRERPELASKVLFMTGDLLSDETRDFLKKGHITVLEKPFLAENVLEAIATVLSRT